MNIMLPHKRSLEQLTDCDDVVSQCLIKLCVWPFDLLSSLSEPHLFSHWLTVRWDFFLTRKEKNHIYRKSSLCHLWLLTHMSHEPRRDLTESSSSTSSNKGRQRTKSFSALRQRAEVKYHNKQQRAAGQELLIGISPVRQSNSTVNLDWEKHSLL